jgi:dTDP-glucose 4,6-dehydratase
VKTGLPSSDRAPADRSILVTGGAGFIGTNLVRYWNREYPKDRVITLDLLTYASNRIDFCNAGREGHTFVYGDICDLALMRRVFDEYRVDGVIHLAAESHVDRSIIDPLAFARTNVLGTASVLEVARQSWQGREDVRFHHVSTDEVFGTLGPTGAFTETTPYDPSSPYSASKAGSDHLVRAYHRTFGLSTVITNCSNNYGPYQYPEKLIPLTLLNALDGNALPIYGDGSHVRDWLFVLDHCRAIDAVFHNGRPGETYNVGGRSERSNLQVVELVCDLLEELAPSNARDPYRSLIRFIQDRPGHDYRYAMDTRRIENELGWKPQESLESGMRKTITWYLEHPDWIKAVRDNDYATWIELNYDAR